MYLTSPIYFFFTLKKKCLILRILHLQPVLKLSVLHLWLTLIKHFKLVWVDIPSCWKRTKPSTGSSWRQTLERGKAESVAWLNHLNHRLSQHNSRENAENLKCVTIMASTQGLFTGINRGNEQNEHNFISPEKEIKKRIHKQMFYFTL